MYATPNYSLYTSLFKKLDLIEVNESMKMGTKMKKIESRSIAEKTLEIYNKLWGQGTVSQPPFAASTAPPLTILSRSSSMVMLGPLSQILSYS